jgi:glycosyltransferase involved in cell wall biosynthesis
VDGLRSIAATPSPPVEVLVVGPGGPIAFSPWGRATVSRRADRWRADLVHGLHVELAPTRVPGVVTVQDLVPLDFPGSMRTPLSGRAYRRVLAASLRRASKIMAPSPATAERLVAHGVDPSRVAVVPMGVGPTFRRLDDDGRGQARRRFGGGRRYVVASSGPRPHKNLAGLARAVEVLGGGVAVVVTGSPPRHAVPPGISFLGRVADADLPRLYGGAEAMVLPAFVEGFGLPALEALACCVPVVCGAGTGAAAYLGDGMLLVDVGRTDELAAGIRALLDDDALRARLGAAGRSQAAALTVEAMARATVAVYLDVLGTPA